MLAHVGTVRYVAAGAVSYQQTPRAFALTRAHSFTTAAARCRAARRAYGRRQPDAPCAQTRRKCTLSGAKHRPKDTRRP